MATTKNSKPAFTLAEIEEAVVGSEKQELTQAYADASRAVLVENIKLEIAAELPDADLTSDEYLKAFMGRYEQRKAEAAEAEKKMKAVKVKNVDSLVVSEFLNRSMDTHLQAMHPEDKERLYGMFDNVSGQRVIWDGDAFVVKGRSTSSSTGEGVERGPSLDSIRVMGADGVPIESHKGGASRSAYDFLMAHATECGFSTEMGSGKDAEGKQRLFHKARTVTAEPKADSASAFLSEKVDDGKWQIYFARTGDVKAGFHDYAMASHILNVGEQVQFLSKDGNVIAYHRKDVNGHTYCSSDGNSNSEVARKVTVNGTTYNEGANTEVSESEA